MFGDPRVGEGSVYLPDGSISAYLLTAMLYLDDKDISSVTIDWNSAIDQIEKAVKTLQIGDFSQPLKPYLRFKNPINRIITMPAYVGGEFNIAGLKWIASFPNNCTQGIPRAHSVIILSDVDTGVPIGIINSARLSSIRTASVSGLIVRSFLAARKVQAVKLGIIGFGPIGQYHLAMCLNILGILISNIYLFDINGINSTYAPTDTRIKICESWQQAYCDADIFITCTTATDRYINIRPKDGSLHLNVSLRDYHTIAYNFFQKTIVVDDWDEVCRENTDIEKMHLVMGLQRENTHSIIDLVIHNCIAFFQEDAPIMFNPMGMAVFDLAIAKYFITLSTSARLGKKL